MNFVGALVLMLTQPPAVASSPVSDTSFVAADGTRTMRLTVTIDAPVDRVWAKFSTVEGWTSWGVKTAFVDFRPGGVIETSYAPRKAKGDRDNIRNQIIDVVPQRMLVFRNIQAPRNFPVDAERFGRIVSTLKLAPVGGKTTVTLSGSGYQEAPADIKLFDFFVRANAFALKSLKSSFGSDHARPNHGGRNQ